MGIKNMGFLHSFSLNDKLQTAKDFFLQHQFQEAKLHYQKILDDFPETKLRPDIFYNTALCCIALDETAHAKNFLEKTLGINPQHVNALNNLGAVLLKQEKFKEALHCFEKAYQQDPEHLEARHNLAACLLQMGHAKDAIPHLEMLLEKNPKDSPLQYSYGIALLDTGRYANAISIFEQLLIEEPHNVKLQSNLGISYLKSGDLEKARSLFKRIIDEHPDQPEISFLYQALSQENIPDKPPVSYVKRLFDQYADYYEQHTLETLHYTAPEIIFQFFMKHFSKQSTLKICDLGCGTGLSGMPFKKIAQQMTGVDLSSQMLKMAENKKIYDALIESDILAFLKNSTQKYDLIISIDTLNYFGDLSQLFANTADALLPFGMFLFSVESNKNEQIEDWSLQAHARYTHSKHYLLSQAKFHSFKLIQIQNIILREQNHEPVEGFMCLLMKGN